MPKGDQTMKDNQIDMITELLIDFDEMGFAPTTLVPDPEAYAIEWRNKITKAFNELAEENERLKLAPKIGSVPVTEALEIINKYCESYIKKARADTVRKMQERLHERKVSYGNITFRVVPIDDIDQIAKEMLEGIE